MFLYFLYWFWSIKLSSNNKLKKVLRHLSIGNKLSHNFFKSQNYFPNRILFLFAISVSFDTLCNNNCRFNYKCSPSKLGSASLSIPELYISLRSQIHITFLKWCTKIPTGTLVTFSRYVIETQLACLYRPRT